MAVRQILQLGNPLLRDTLHNFQQRNGFGRGISAVQIGVPERLLYLEIGGRAYELVAAVGEKQ